MTLRTKYKFWLLQTAIILAGVLGCQKYGFTADSGVYEVYAKELIAMHETDQMFRRTSRELDNESIQKMREIDAENSKKLKEIITAIGWPTEQKVGAEASKSAFFIAQHAIGDLSLMELSLKNMEISFRSGQTSGIYYAMIYDRLKMLHGDAQKYGTQIMRDGTKCYPYKIEDVGTVNLRRTEVGLTQNFESYVNEVCSRKY